MVTFAGLMRRSSDTMRTSGCRVRTRPPAARAAELSLACAAMGGRAKTKTAAARKAFIGTPVRCAWQDLRLDRIGQSRWSGAGDWAPAFAGASAFLIRFAHKKSWMAGAEGIEPSNAGIKI